MEIDAMGESLNVAFSSRQLRFIDWLAETKFDRKPATQELLAKEIGVSTRTLVRWKKRSDIREATHQRTRELLRDDFPEILGALRREAAKGNFQHIKLALEMLGEYVPTERQEISGKDGGPIKILDVTKLTDDELKRIADGEDPTSVIAPASPGGT